MSDLPKLIHPWMIAVWPGMGNVGVSAGYYMMARLGMHLLSELSSQGLFDVDHVEVKSGLIRTGRLPRNRLFIWKDPDERRDLVVFLGEAQPATGKYAFCERLMDVAQQLGVERVFTFAAMATQMHPEHDSRVFTAATDEKTLFELRQHDLQVLEEGNISGLNGVLLGVAAERGLAGASFLGEMPHIFAQLPFPKASLAVLQAFAQIARLDIDVSELAEQARIVDEKLGELLARAEGRLGGQQPEEEEETFGSLKEEPEEERLSPRDRQKIEQLFEQAAQDRARAYELKAELDRLEAFQEYEDRFLDLFKNPGYTEPSVDPG